MSSTSLEVNRAAALMIAEEGKVVVGIPLLPVGIAAVAHIPTLENLRIIGTTTAVIVVTPQVSKADRRVARDPLDRRLRERDLFKL